MNKQQNQQQKKQQQKQQQKDYSKIRMKPFSSAIKIEDLWVPLLVYATLGMVDPVVEERGTSTSFGQKWILFFLGLQRTGITEWKQKSTNL